MSRVRAKRLTDKAHGGRNQRDQAETTVEKEAETTVEDKEFVFLRDKGEKEPVFKQFEFILRDNYGEPRLDHEGKKIVVMGLLPTR